MLPRWVAWQGPRLEWTKEASQWGRSAIVVEIAPPRIFVAEDEAESREIEAEIESAERGGGLIHDKVVLTTCSISTIF